MLFLMVVMFSYKTGDSEVEQMADSIWARRQHRYNVTKPVRLRLLKRCRQIAVENEYPKRNYITYSDLLELRKDVAEEADQQHMLVSFTAGWMGLVGLKPEIDQLVDVIDKAIELIQANDLHTENDLEEEFYYEEFVFDHVHAVSPYPWMRPGLHRPLIGIFLYYLLTPVWFCHLVPDENVCERGENNRLGTGWVSSLYFASMTLSTVGERCEGQPYAEIVAHHGLSHPDGSSYCAHASSCNYLSFVSFSFLFFSLLLIHCTSWFLPSYRIR